MKKLFLILLLIISACKKEDKKEHAIIHRNDFESLLGWVEIDPSRLVKGSSHSGNYSALSDSMHPYSIGFIRKLNEISDQKIKKIRMNAWVLSHNLEADALLVLSIESESKTAFYKGIAVMDSIQATDKWYPVRCLFDLPSDLSPEKEVRIYLWNRGKTAVLVDDFELSFYN